MVTTVKTIRKDSNLLYLVLCLVSCVLCLAQLTNTATAATYYLDAVDGNDANTGDSTHPWKTLPRAMTSWTGAVPRVTNGDTIKLRSGNYGAFYEMNILHTDWITYEADTNQTPVLTNISINHYTANPPYGWATVYLRFNGITVDVPAKGNSGCNIGRGGFFEFLNMKIIGAGYVISDGSAGISISDSNNIIINNCQIYGDGPGYDGNTSLSGMSGSLFGKGFATGIASQEGSPCQNVLITDCNIWSCDLGIWITDSNWLVQNNEIQYMTTDGINVAASNTAASGRTAPIIISNNHIHHLGQFTGYSYHNDLIQFKYQEINHVIIRNNRLHDSDQQGIFCRPVPTITSTDWLFENNLIYRCNLALGNDYAVRIYGGTGIVFRNNTIGGDQRGLTGATASGGMLLSENESGVARWTSFYGNIISQLDLYTDGNNATIFDYENYNIIRATWIHTTSHTLGNHTLVLSSDAAYKALFKDYDNNDFTLAPDALAINFGNPSYAPSSDILGVSRSIPPDAGCYEYISAQTYTLNTTAVNGTVAKSPDKASYNSGETVTLQATPNTGYDFANWSGDASGTNNPVTITMNSNKSVTANFAVHTPTTYTLSITATNGSVTKTPDKTSYNYGETVTIQAVPNTGYAFTNWSGNASGNSNPVTITMNTNKSVTANFVYMLVDEIPPSPTGYSPQPDSIQVPLNTLVTLHVTDSGKGVDANSVTIKVNNNTVYSGNTADYSSQYGHCRRAGAAADYAFIYQPNTALDYDQTVNVAVNAKDLAGNAMNQYSYSFATEMRSFGRNKMVNSDSNNIGNGNPAAVRDSAGNIWAAWDAGSAGSRDVYVGRLAAGADGFDAGVQVTIDSADQYNAAVAIDAADKLYLVWQDKRRGNWDIYISTSVDGINWSAERRVTDSNNNAVNPAIAVDHSSPPKVYVAWQDDRADNQEIYIASSSDGFATGTISRVTTNGSDQVEPALAVNSANTVYVAWADSRNGSSDIYGAASNNGPWTNVPIVTGPANQTSPAIATEAAGAILHLLWVDDTAGNKDIYYAASNGLPATALTGRNIVDDGTGADQLTPAIITTGSTGAGLRVFACWQDRRNAVNNGDTDLYFVEVSSGSGTNIFAGDDAANSNQAAPVIGVDGYGYPYLVWVDDRNQNTDIYYAGSTFVRSIALASQSVSPSSGATIGTDPASITGVDDVSIVMPAGASPCELNITISKVENPPKLSVPLFSSSYEFGPSGADFAQPVTITIPYIVSSDASVSAYWYNTLAGTSSQRGITNVETVVISPTLYALRFKTTHFTQFFVGGSSGDGGGGGGGGGCALSSPGQAGFVEFLLPYIGLAAVMMIINRRDKQNREIRRATGNKR